MNKWRSWLKRSKNGLKKAGNELTKVAKLVTPVEGEPEGGVKR